jgi:transposase
MPRKLSQEEVVTLKTLKARSQSNCQIARVLGITEGAVRYRLRRDGQPDGRRNKPRKADEVAAAIEHWIEDQQARGASRPVNVMLLFEWLRGEHGYRDSYRSVLRLVRAKYPRPKVRPLRRVETPPGAQAQADWSEFSEMDVGDGPQKLHAFVMVLSHSRKEAVIWSPQVDQLAWHHVHNEALRRLGGVPAVLRIDNLKTGIARGAGPWGQVNQAYRAYARSVGFHVDACLPDSPEDKGKVESKVRFLRRFDLHGRRFDSLADLQSWTDRRLAHSDCDRICPATGLSVEASWRMEQRYLRPLGILPEVFDLAVTRSVYKDCTVSFEGRTYSVPFTLCRLLVEVRGCAEVVQILHDGRVVAEHPRHSRKRLQIDPAHYEGPGDDRVDPPVPLGRMGRRLTEIVMQPVEERPLDLYAALMEVAR